MINAGLSELVNEWLPLRIRHIGLFSRAFSLSSPLPVTDGPNENGGVSPAVWSSFA
jgi:hypothetical protein